MIKLLHSADWHLDSPLMLRSEEQTQLLRQTLQSIPGQIARLCRDHGCHMLLLSGDIFDGPASPATVAAVRNALEEVQIPVFISPGNHDFMDPNSPWLRERWPGNVHIFTHPTIESVAIPQLDCRVYGAGFSGMDCPPLLEGFTAQQTERYAIGVLHGDPTQTRSPYCPITAQQVEQSGLDYLALGHIHKAGSFTAGKTLCAWPGCPAGRGFDEQGEKGVSLITLEESAKLEFLSLDAPRFYDLQIPATQTLSSILPPVGNHDFYRITMTGPSEPLDLDAMQAQFSQFPNLMLRDRTTPPVDIWGAIGEDSLEGLYFKRLRDALDQADEDRQRQIRLAAQISRQLLDGQEVAL